ncbi:GNAT family N-acetyltransferase [Solitalea sp. MAHUQ-68]|uniref:GNAT family N-acetyltransferase n=1 Tax=Solitalea agri TaxID=2953739 RepID=A0A9X2JC96_9SPHI|nr:GNAT family N-acetyltransferase [Solitalea agri]MCO4292269.1 GNAT family N-acetyltransferase [Solitalea agri]
MTIIEVKDAKTKKEFLEVAVIINKKDPVWVRPLDSDIESIFDPKRNNFHAFGEATRWVLKDNNGNLIGRVAAFINQKKAYQSEVPTGGMGFFECIDDKKAAFILFDTCKKWLAERGMKAMDGPINFGENDTYWGLLIDGFVHPSFGMQYNPPYYQKFFELYGFTQAYQQYTNTIPIALPARVEKIADWVIAKPGYSFEYLTVNKFDKFAADFEEIYNDAWQDFENFVPISKEILLDSFEKMKPIMDEQLIWFAYVNNEPASFIVCLPDANQIIKHLNGKLNLWGKLKFVYYKWRGKMDRIRVVVMGTKQAYQKHGLESALFRKLQFYVLPQNHYTEAELSWVGDFNTKMQAIHAALGATRSKTHATYRFIFPE